MLSPANITNIADFRKNLSMWLARLDQHQEPLVLVRHGKPVAVMKHYDRDMSNIKIDLSTKKNRTNNRLLNMMGNINIPDFDIHKMNRFLRQAKYGK